MTGTNEFESLERELEAVFAAPVPALNFAPSLRPSTARFGRRRSWQAAGIGAVAAALLSVVAFLPGYFGGATTVSAEELLSRSADASAKLKTSSSPYHIRESFEGKGNQPFVTETWSFGAAGNRSETRSPDGALLYGQTVTPADTWLYATVEGQLRVVHIGGGEEARLRDFDAGSTSLEELLGGMVIQGCQEAVSRGSARIAGRDAYVIEVVPTPATCTADPKRPELQKLAGAAEDLGSFTVWIDKATTLQLKVEARDPAGVVTRSFQALSFESGASVDASVLSFVPPAGAVLLEAANYSDAKSSLYGSAK